MAASFEGLCPSRRRFFFFKSAQLTGFLGGLLEGLCPLAVVNKHNKNKKSAQLTGFLGGLLEGLYALLAVGTGLCDGVDVLPLQRHGDVHHGLRLVRVRGDHSGEVLEPALVTQVAAGGGVADLWDLEARQNNQ